MPKVSLTVFSKKNKQFYELSAYKSSPSKSPTSNSLTATSNRNNQLSTLCSNASPYHIKSSPTSVCVRGRSFPDNADLSNRNLSKHDYSNQTIKNANLNRSLFSSANFSFATLLNTTCVNAIFNDANFYGARLSLDVDKINTDHAFEFLGTMRAIQSIKPEYSELRQGLMDQVTNKISSLVKKHCNGDAEIYIKQCRMVENATKQILTGTNVNKFNILFSNLFENLTALNTQRAPLSPTEQLIDIETLQLQKLKI